MEKLERIINLPTSQETIKLSILRELKESELKIYRRRLLQQFPKFKWKTRGQNIISKNLLKVNNLLFDKTNNPIYKSHG